MKFQMMRTVALSATLAVAGAAACFGAQPAKVGFVGKAEAPNPADVAKAVQFGKGTGAVRYREALPSETSKDASKTAVGGAAAGTHGSTSDVAFRK